MLRKRLLVGIAFTLALVACAPRRGNLPAVGQSMPVFSAKDLNGRLLRLADSRGRPVLLDFWATWCGPCKEEFPAFQRLVQAFPELLVIAVAYGEDAAQIRPYVEQSHLPFTFIPDAGANLARVYGVRTLPTTFLIDADSMVRWSQVGKAELEDVRAALAACTSVGTPVALATSPTPQPDPSATPSPAQTDIPTLTVTAEPAAGPSPSPSAMRPITASATPTLEPSATSRPSATFTRVPPSATPQPPTAPAPTAAPEATATLAPSRTPTRRPSPTPTHAPSALRLESCCSDKPVYPGQTAVFDVVLTNAGGGRDIFDLWIGKALPPNWQGMFCFAGVCYFSGPIAVELDAGAQLSIEVKLRAAENAANGSAGHATLYAGSQFDPNARGAVAVTARVEWPTATPAPSATPIPTPQPSQTLAPSPMPTDTPPQPTAVPTSEETATPVETPGPSATPSEPIAPTATIALESLIHVKRL